MIANEDAKGAGRVYRAVSIPPPSIRGSPIPPPKGRRRDRYQKTWRASGWPSAPSEDESLEPRLFLDNLNFVEYGVSLPKMSLGPRGILGVHIPGCRHTHAVKSDSLRRCVNEARRSNGIVPGIAKLEQALYGLGSAVLCGPRDAGIWLDASGGIKNVCRSKSLIDG